MGYVAAALNLISSLSIFGGGDTRGLFTATGHVAVVFGYLPFEVWVAAVSTAMLSLSKGPTPSVQDALDHIWLLGGP